MIDIHKGIYILYISMLYTLLTSMNSIVILYHRKCIPHTYTLREGRTPQGVILTHTQPPITKYDYAVQQFERT